MTQIRIPKQKDLNSIYNILKNDPYINWTKESLAKEIRDNYCLISETNNFIEGFLSSVLISNFEAQITAIFVQEALRRHKIGTKLLTKLYAECIKNNINAMTLEVGEKNTPALIFYKTNGFEQVGQRKHYYSNGENAVILKKTLINNT